jgi:hypothetical protein
MADKGQLLVKCVHCDRDFQLDVKASDIIAWSQGKFVQDAFPYLNADERELLISNTCKECWSNMFLDEDELFI